MYFISKNYNIFPHYTTISVFEFQRLSQSRSLYQTRGGPPSRHKEPHQDAEYLPMLRKSADDRGSGNAQGGTLRGDTVYCPVDQLLHQAEESVV